MRLLPCVSRAPQPQHAGLAPRLCQVGVLACVRQPLIRGVHCRHHQCTTFTPAAMHNHKNSPNPAIGLATTCWGTEQLKQQYPQLAEDTDADVCVVGGGISGLTTAYLLAKAGAYNGQDKQQRRNSNALWLVCIAMLTCCRFFACWPLRCIFSCMQASVLWCWR